MTSPLMAGQLADLPGKYPERFGNNAFLKAWPYAPPALMSGFFLLLAFLGVFFFLEEVNRGPDHVLTMRTTLADTICGLADS